MQIGWKITKKGEPCMGIGIIQNHSQYKNICGNYTYHMPIKNEAIWWWICSDGKNDGDNNLYRNAFTGASTSATVKGYGSGVVDLSLLITGTNKNNRFIGSLSNDSDEEYRLGGYVEELDRFLNKVSNGNVTADDLWCSGL